MWKVCQHSSIVQHLVVDIACTKTLPASEEAMEDSEVAADCRTAEVLLRKLGQQ